MPTIKQFLLPDPAEGLTEADIVSWKVSVGDTVEMNQPIVDIETAKSLVELPSPYAGVVVEIHVEEGATVEVGSPIISIDIDPDGPADDAGTDDHPDRAAGSPSVPPEAAGPTPTGQPDDGGSDDSSDGETRQPVLVGYGPKPSVPKRRPRRAWPKAFGPGSGVAASAANVLNDEFSAQRPVSMPVAPPPPPRPVRPVHDAGRGGLPPVGTVSPPPLPPDVRARAKPPVRKLARDLGVDLATVGGTGKDGLVTRADVEAVAQAASAPAAAPAIESVAPPGREERIAIAGVRKATAEVMVRSAFTAPHVTEWVSVDVTNSLALLRKLRSRKEFNGLKLTPLALVARALCLAVRRNPGINSTWDSAAGEIVLKHYVNLGIATATTRGLLVPNIKDADTMDVRALAQALAELTRSARDGTTPPAAMRGGTITITNVGVFGVDGGTPLINPPEAAILAMGQVRAMPWVVEGELAVRDVMQLTLSFDHRLVDGDLGSRVLADVAAVLEAPELALAWA